MPEPKQPRRESIPRVSLRPDLLQQVLGGAKYSRRTFEARLELLLVSQKELVRARQAADNEQSDASKNQLERAKEALAKARDVQARLTRERDEARQKALALDEQLAMARFWQRVRNREIVGTRTALGRLREELEFERIHGRAMRVGLALVLVVLGLILGYVMRPYVEPPPALEEVETPWGVSLFYYSPPPAMPRACEDHR